LRYKLNTDVFYLLNIEAAYGRSRLYLSDDFAKLLPRRNGNVVLNY